ncbi:MAG: lipoyl(octanoyl) transferase LipB [Erysipelotrichaceae bacterium]
MTTVVQTLDLGRMDYRKAYAIQAKIHQDRYENRIQDTILFQENDPIFTLGRNSSDDHLLRSREELKALGIDLEYVDRGGDITYHGPGQLVISPILSLRDHSISVHQYLRNLEETIIRLLRKYAIDGQRIPGSSGVWVDQEKIAAVGIAIQHGITRHGISINVCPDLNHFSYIIPCGILDKGVTSLKKLGVLIEDMDTFKADYLIEFNAVFHTTTHQIQFDQKED